LWVARASSLLLRVGWIIVRLLLVLWLGERGLSFYYQGF
jgi:hypothetical protein